MTTFDFNITSVLDYLDYNESEKGENMLSVAKAVGRSVKLLETSA